MFLQQNSRLLTASSKTALLIKLLYLDACPNGVDFEVDSTDTAKVCNPNGYGLQCSNGYTCLASPLTQALNKGYCCKIQPGSGSDGTGISSMNFVSDRKYRRTRLAIARLS